MPMNLFKVPKRIYDYDISKRPKVTHQEMSSLYKKSEVQKRHTSYYIEPARPSLVANYNTRSTIGHTKNIEVCNS